MCSSLVLRVAMVHAGVIRRSDEVCSDMTYKGTSAMISDFRILPSPTKLLNGSGTGKND